MRVLLLLLGLALSAAIAGAQDISAVIINGRSMVPLRYVSESFGASVTYDSHSKDIGISLSYQKVNMSAGNTVAVVGGKHVELDTAPIIIAGVTYVPVRFVSVNLGMSVIWISETRHVKIVSPKSGKTIVLVIKEKSHHIPPGHRYHGTPGHGGAIPGHGGTPPGHVGKGDHGNKSDDQGERSHGNSEKSTGHDKDSGGKSVKSNGRGHGKH